LLTNNTSKYHIRFNYSTYPPPNTAEGAKKELILKKEPAKIKPVPESQLLRQGAIDFSGCSMPQTQTLAAVWAWLLGWHASAEINDRIAELRERSDAAKLEFQKERKVRLCIRESRIIVNLAFHYFPFIPILY
jgi:hypothetical protein